jgi:hypothetical protein
MNELVTTDSAPAIKDTSDLSVIAHTPDEMKSANLALIAWCDQKIRELRAEHVELSASAAHARKMKWQWKTLHAQAEKTAKRMIYFGKMRQALKEGFFIVPNFPVNVFAIRTSRESPLRMMSLDENYGYLPFRHKQQPSGMLPEGEGEYKNPFPFVAHSKKVVTRDDGKTQTNWAQWATQYKDVEFPLSMAKPQIMEATSRAMALKLFDDFGIFEGHTQMRSQHIERRVTRDPIIVARLKDPRSTTYEWRGISFIVAWHLDTAVL